jgi:inner membrane protein
MGVMLAGLYGYLYVLLQLEDYALLLGTVGLFAILAAVMYLTRNLDWYATDLAAGRAPNAEPAR